MTTLFEGNLKPRQTNGVLKIFLKFSNPKWRLTTRMSLSAEYCLTKINHFESSKTHPVVNVSSA